MVGRDYPEVSWPPRDPGTAACAQVSGMGSGSRGKALCNPDFCPLSIRLFQMSIGPPRKLEDLDRRPGRHWRLLRKHNIWRHNRR